MGKTNYQTANQGWFPCIFPESHDSSHRGSRALATRLKFHYLALIYYSEPGVTVVSLATNGHYELNTNSIKCVVNLAIAYLTNYFYFGEIQGPAGKRGERGFKGPAGGQVSANYIFIPSLCLFPLFSSCYLVLFLLFFSSSSRSCFCSCSLSWSSFCCRCCFCCCCCCCSFFVVVVLLLFPLVLLAFLVLFLFSFSLLGFLFSPSLFLSFLFLFFLFLLFSPFFIFLLLLALLLSLQKIWINSRKTE